VPLSPDVIRATREFWSHRTGAAVSADDACQAIGNVAALFDLLERWDREARGEESPAAEEEAPPAAANATGQSAGALTPGGEGTDRP